MQTAVTRSCHREKRCEDNAKKKMYKKVATRCDKSLLSVRRSEAGEQNSQILNANKSIVRTLTRQVNKDTKFNC